MESTSSVNPERALSTTLLQLLSNTLVLYQTAPYLPVSSLFALGATSKSFKDLIYNTPKLFRYLDLSEVKSAQSAIGSIDHGGEVWRNVQLDENVTEDDFYGGPQRGIFHSLRKRNILQDVQTLILDGLAVPADLVAEIITSDDFNVRILSIRGVKHLNQRKLQQALLYAIRPSRETPLRLQGLYIFGPPEPFASAGTTREHSLDSPQIRPNNTGVMSSQGAQIGAQWNAKSGDALAEAMNKEQWFERSGEIFPGLGTQSGWAEVIQACQGIISFDAVLCAGPRHSAVDAAQNPAWYHKIEYYFEPKIATHSLLGCDGCGRAPEGLAVPGHSPMDRFPLLAPPTLQSSTVKAAKTPSRGNDMVRKLMVRCKDCLRGRHCECCQVWWCEDCYPTSSYGYQNTVQGCAESAQTGKNVKVHMGLCVQNCLVIEMMSGAGSNGMWG